MNNNKKLNDGMKYPTEYEYLSYETTSSSNLKANAGEYRPVFNQVLNNDADLDPQNQEPYVEVSFKGSKFYVPHSSAPLYVETADSAISTVASGALRPSGSHVSVNSDPVISLNRNSFSNTQRHEFTRDDDSLINEVYDSPVSVKAPLRRTVELLGMPSKLNEYFRLLDLETLKEMEPDDERYKELPTRYHMAHPLDDPTISKGSYGSFGFPSSTFKAVDRSDSRVYLIRRLDNIKINSNVVKNSLTRWVPVNHPCIVKLHDISNEKGALFFSYSYYAGATTLRQRFIDQRGPLLNESLIWKILLQLLSAIRCVHQTHGLAVRLIHPVHVILTSGSVARISSVGVADVTEFESRRSLTEFQRDDFVRLGYLVLSLASRAIITSKNADSSLLILQKHFSQQLNHAVEILLSGDLNSCATVSKIGAENILDELESSLLTSDTWHSHLSNEYENGRLFRLILKLGFINERPDPSNSIASGTAWSENGDQYILKLFRDYVFHQNDSSLRPILDAGHVVNALNKLDVGSSEQIVLCSRDSKDLIIVSFKDVKRCLENSFCALEQQSNMSDVPLMSQRQGVESTYGSSPSKNRSQKSTVSSYAPVSSFEKSSPFMPSRNTPAPTLYSSSSSSLADNFGGMNVTAPSFNPVSANKAMPMSMSTPSITRTPSLNMPGPNLLTSSNSPQKASHYPSMQPKSSPFKNSYSQPYVNDNNMNDQGQRYDSQSGLGLKPTAQEWKPQRISSISGGYLSPSYPDEQPSSNARPMHESQVSEFYSNGNYSKYQQPSMPFRGQSQDFYRSEYSAPP